MASKGRLPSAARLLVRLTVPRAIRDEVEGDLAERYAEMARIEGDRAAARWLRWQLLTLRPWAMRGGRSRAGDHDGGGMMGGRGWGSDLRQGLRSLKLRPGASLTVVVTVVLAVGATTSVFSVVDGVLLRPLPYPDSDGLVRAWQTKNSWFDSPNSQLRAFASQFPLSVPTFNDWTEANTGFGSLGAYSDRSWVHQGPDGAEILRGQGVTSGFFETLGVEPILGRRLMPRDDAIGAARVLVIDESVWDDRYGRGADVLGTTLTLDGEPHEIVGVMPAEFDGPVSDGPMWTPLDEAEKAGERNSQYLNVVARLADGVSIDAAAERLEAVQAGLAESYPDVQGDVGSRVEGLLDSVVGNVRATLWFLLGAVGLVLVVATLNIANVLSVLGLTRQRELAVKAALGAGSRRLMRGLFIESAVLATIGGIGGVALAWISLPLLLGLVPSSVPRSEAITVSPSVLVFGLAVTAITTLLVGILPAAQAAQAQPYEMMRSATRGATAGRGGRRLRSGMVMAEVALASVLLVAAGLLGNSLARLWSVERGFATEGLVLVRVAADPVEYPEREDRERFVRELRERLDAIPGVTSSATNQVPLSNSMSTTTYHVERTEGEPEETNVIISIVLENYLRLMEIPIVAGRDFAATDTRDAALVGIVNEAMAEVLWPGENAVGKRLRSDLDEPWVEVVGIAANVQHQGLAIETEPKLYIPSAQSGRTTNAWVLRIRGDVAGSIELARGAVGVQSPSTPVRGVQILEETIAESVAVPRFRTLFVMALSVLAAVLALLGVYGVVTFAVAQRMREIGVRMALGASASGVVRDVVGSGLKLVIVGIGFGLAIAWQAGRYIADFLFQVTPTDVATYASIAVSIVVVSALAAYVPARRAAAVDPVSVLNSE